MSAIAPRALLMAAGGMASFAAMDAVVKTLGGVLPTFEIVFVRFAGATLWLGLFILVFRRPWPQRRYLGRHTLRAALTLVTAFSFFYALRSLPLALTTALAMSAPIYVGLLSAVFLREKLVRSLLLAVALGIVGSLMVILGDPEAPITGGGGDALAWLAAVLAPMTYAVQIVLLKSHASDEPATAISFAQGTLVAIAALPLALMTGFVVPEPEIWPLVVLVGMLGTLGYLLFVSALKLLPASVFALVDYTALLWSALFGFVFFAEVPGLWLWLGGALIISACFVGMRGGR